MADAVERSRCFILLLLTSSAMFVLPSQPPSNNSRVIRRLQVQEQFHLDGSDSAYIALEDWWQYRHVIGSHHLHRVSEKLMSHKASCDVSLEIATQNIAARALLMYALRVGQRKDQAGSRPIDTRSEMEFFEIKQFGDVLKLKYKRHICCQCLDLESTHRASTSGQQESDLNERDLNISGYGVYVTGLLVTSAGVLIPRKWHTVELKVYASKLELLVDGVIQVSKSDHQVCILNKSYVRRSPAPPDPRFPGLTQPKTFTIFVGGLPKLESLAR